MSKRANARSLSDSGSAAAVGANAETADPATSKAIPPLAPHDSKSALESSELTSSTTSLRCLVCAERGARPTPVVGTETVSGGGLNRSAENQTDSVRPGWWRSSAGADDCADVLVAKRARQVAGDEAVHD